MIIGSFAKKCNLTCVDVIIWYSVIILQIILSWYFAGVLFRTGHRRALDRSRNALEKSFREREKAEYYHRKAEAAEKNNAIYTKDDNAIERLEEKVAVLENLQQTMKERNKVVKNKKLTPDEKIARLVEMGISDKDAHDLLQPDFCGRIKYADYQLTSNNAKIRSTKQRK